MRQDQLSWKSWTTLFLILGSTTIGWSFQAGARQLTQVQQDDALIDNLVDSGTLFLGRIQLGDLNVEEVEKTIANYWPLPRIEVESQNAIRLLKLLNSQGVTTIWIASSLTDWKTRIVILPPQPSETIKEIVASSNLKADVETSATQTNITISAFANQSNTPLGKDESNRFEKAFAQLGDSSIAIVVAPSADQRRVLSEVLPGLVSKFPAEQVRDGIQGPLSIVLSANKELQKFDLTIACETESAAKNLDGTLQHLMQTFESMPNCPAYVTELIELINVATVTENGSQITRSLDSTATNQLSQFLRIAEILRFESRHLLLQNNIRECVLAQHNYHDSHKGLRLVGASDKDGKPLMSWRVAMLPFMDEMKLYKQFHLDEPWDSEHNKKLVPLMPKLFHHPESSKLNQEGKCRFQVPTGNGAISNGEDLVKFSEIKDGTSNTAMIVEVDESAAIEWTKPEDWAYQPGSPTQGLGNINSKRVVVGFADGHVEAISLDKIDLLKSIMTRSAGDIVVGR